METKSLTSKLLSLLPIIIISGLLSFIFITFIIWSPDDDGRHIAKNIIYLLLGFLPLVTFCKSVVYLFRKRFFSAIRLLTACVVFFAVPFIINWSWVSQTLDDFQFSQNEAKYEQITNGSPNIISVYLGINGQNMKIMVYDGSANSNLDTLSEKLPNTWEPEKTQIRPIQPHYYLINTYDPTISRSEAPAKIGDIFQK